MIISQTPLRISFAGGGTDFKDFYKKEYGSVVSTAIDKNIYVIVKERFDKKIRIGYSKTEIVNNVNEIQHDLVKECLKEVGITEGIEISTMADIPSEGSGLGSSSSVTVGLLNALRAFIGKTSSAEYLAETACKIEIDILKKPIGKQDQYIAAFGGLSHFIFHGSETVEQRPIEISNADRNLISENTMLFYTGVERKADNILQDQSQNIKYNTSILREMRDQADYLAYYLSIEQIYKIGDTLGRGWELKKKLSEKISNDEINILVNLAYGAGAAGVKIAGAGGGGFILIYTNPDNKKNIREILKNHQELPIQIGCEGSKIIFNIKR